MEQKKALTITDITQVLTRFSGSSDHNELLFVSLLLSAFFALYCLGELTFPDDSSLHDWHKIICRSSITLSSDHYGYNLPAHKADHKFEGSHIVVWGEQSRCPTLPHFTSYLNSRDAKFPLASPLWLTSAGSVPTQSFFISCLRTFCPPAFTGQSLQAGGATMLASKGAAPYIIQAAGRWSSDAFRLYVYKNPFLLQALIFANPTISF